MKTNTENQSLSVTRGAVLDVMLLVFLGVAIFFPTSVNGDFGKLALERFAFLILVLSVLGYRFFAISLVSLIVFSLIMALYLFFTLVSEYAEYAFGYMLSLFPILLLAVLRIKTPPSATWVIRLYYIVVFLVFFLAYAGFIIPVLADFRVNFYSGGYEGLAERFQAQFIPVSIFVSHSYAGFFYFLILFSSCHLISCGFSKLANLLIIVICLISMLALMSGSSYFFFLYSISFLVFLALFSNHRTYFFIFLKVLFAVALVLSCIYFGLELLPTFFDRVIGDSGNGLLSRYGDGVLASSLEYIYKNPLMGIGFSYSDDFYYTDSDYVVTALRLGILGGAVYFFYLFLFFYSSIRRSTSLPSFLFLFFSVSAFMVSMPISSFYRTAPFFTLLVLLFSATRDFNVVKHPKNGQDI